MEASILMIYMMSRSCRVKFVQVAPWQLGKDMHALVHNVHCAHHAPSDHSPIKQHKWQHHLHQPHCTSLSVL